MHLEKNQMNSPLTKIIDLAQLEDVHLSFFIII